MPNVVNGPGVWRSVSPGLSKLATTNKEPIPRFFSWHDAHPMSLSIVLLETFGPQWIGWESDTLKSEIITEFNISSISENNWQKIQSCRTLSLTTSFWESWEVFEKILQALNNNFPRFDTCQPCTMAQLMAGVDIANSVRENPYGEEIQKYVAACAINEGITYLPEPLDFASRALARPQYRCLDCGNIDTDDLEDGRCDFCSGRFDDIKNMNFKARPDIPENVGTNIQKFVTREPGPAGQRYEELVSVSGELVVDEDIPEDVQAAKLVVAYRYMILRREQLANQLRDIKLWVKH